MKSLGLFFLLLLALLAVPMLLPSDGAGPPALPEQGMPWQIEALPDGFARVFGVVPGRSTLAEARALFKGTPEIALIVAPGDSGSLEAYYDSFAAGPLTGKMVVTLDSTPERREQMLQRARKAEYMESSTRRIALADEDLLWAETAVVAGLAFIPSANLDEAVALERFGAPAERIRDGEHREHFLYPDKGLELQIDAKGKEVLQYVAPRDFGRLLRDPLVAAKK